MDHNNLQDIHEFSNMERKRNAFASKSNVGFHPQKNANPIYNYYADGQKYLDEPTANLDADTTEIIISEIVHMAKERLVIVASHEHKFEVVADSILNLNWGEKMAYA